MGIKLVPPLKHMKLKDVSVLQDLSNDDRELVKNPEISPSPSSYMKISVGRQCGVSKSFVFERRSLRSDNRGNAEKAI